MTQEQVKRIAAALDRIGTELRLANELKMLVLRQEYDVVKLADIAGKARRTDDGSLR